MRLILNEETFDSADAQVLVAALDAEFSLSYSPDQMFGKNLRAEHLEEGRGVFVIARLDGRPVGCGAIRRLDAATAELKRMYVDPEVRGRGFGKEILSYLVAAGRQMSVRRLVLETGVHQLAAISLYRQAGFTSIDCFGEYAGSPTSLCFEMAIQVDSQPRPSLSRLEVRGRFRAVKATAWNQKTIDEFHAKRGLGVGMWGDHVLLMTAKGARSGESITTPLVYGRDGDDYVIVASKGGAPNHPAWFGNIKANPEVEVEVAAGHGTEKFMARAHVVESRAERDRLFEEMSKIWPSYRDYQTRTERLIPVAILKRERG